MFTCIENSFLRSQMDNNILKFEVIGRTPSDLEWDMSKAMVDTWYKYLEDANIRVGMLFLLQNLIFIKPKQLMEWKQIFNEKREKTKKYIIASAIIVENGIIRTVINTFFSSFQSERPVKFVKNIEDGINFINSIS
jgi:hypothetical protein